MQASRIPHYPLLPPHVSERWFVYVLAIFVADAMENIQSLLSSEKAWSPRYEDAADVDDLKVPECVETFVSLLVGITGMV